MMNHCSAHTYLQHSPGGDSTPASPSSGDAVEGAADSEPSLTLPSPSPPLGSRVASLDPNSIGIFREHALHPHSVVCEIRRSGLMGSRIVVHEVDKACRVDQPLWSCKPIASCGPARTLYISHDDGMAAILSRDKQGQRWECRATSEILPPTSLLKKKRPVENKGALLFAVQFRANKKDPHVELPINYASSRAGAPAVEVLPIEFHSDRHAADWQLSTPWGRVLAIVHRSMGFRTQASVHVAPFVDLFLSSMIAIAGMEEEALSEPGSAY